MRPKRWRYFGSKWRFRPTDINYNCILFGKGERDRRISPVGEWHWDELRGQWVIWGKVWNRFSKTWSEPQLLHCYEFELEGASMSYL